MSGACGWYPLGSEAISAWVEAHRSELPQSLAELARFPVPFRKAIAAALPIDVRVALWREHLATFLAPRSTLSIEQQQLVRDAMVELPMIFDEDRNAGLVRATALEDRMRSLITRQQAREMFGILGPPETPEGLPMPPDAQPRAAE